MGKVIVLVGGTCSGKTTLLKELEKRGHKRIVTYTTRQKRDGEKNGRDYHFITKEGFKQKFVGDFFAEFTTYNTDAGVTMYGSAAEDYKNCEDSVIILDAIGVMSLTVPAFVVHLDIPYATREKRSTNRGDCPVEFYTRWRTDEQYIDKMYANDIRPDLVIKQSRAVEKLADRILKAYKASQKLHII